MLLHPLLISSPMKWAATPKPVAWEFRHEGRSWTIRGQQGLAGKCRHLCKTDRGRRRRAGDLLVLPEGILRAHTLTRIRAQHRQPLDGRFMAQWPAESRKSNMTIMMCVHVPTGGQRVFNNLVAIRGGEVISQYLKLHLDDAFAAKESTNVQPGTTIPELIEVAGMKLGLMTCYDWRFPGLARRHAVDGADVLILPAAWVEGARQGGPLGGAGHGESAGKHLLFRRCRRMRRTQYRRQYGRRSSWRCCGSRR